MSIISIIVSSLIDIIMVVEGAIEGWMEDLYMLVGRLDAMVVISMVAKTEVVTELHSF